MSTALQHVLAAAAAAGALALLWRMFRHVIWDLVEFMQAQAVLRDLGKRTDGNGHSTLPDDVRKLLTEVAEIRQTLAEIQERLSEDDPP